VPFSEEEIKHAVHQMPSDKAQGVTDTQGSSINPVGILLSQMWSRLQMLSTRCG
jgi:hypothetical protein